MSGDDFLLGYEGGPSLRGDTLLDAEQLSTRVSMPAAVAGSEPSLEALASGVSARTLPPGFTGLRDALRDYEAQLIAQALEQAAGNQTRAAELLEVPRRTLVRKLHALRQRDTTALHPPQPMSIATNTDREKARIPATYIKDGVRCDATARRCESP